MRIYFKHIAQEQGHNMTKMYYRVSLKNLSLAEQGYIYYYSQLYNMLPDQQRHVIDSCCKQAGGEYEQALKQYVTTDWTSTKICMTYYISQSTLERCVQKYYRVFPLPHMQQHKQRTKCKKK